MTPRLRIGVIGLGFGEKVHIPALLSTPAFEVYAVCSEHRKNAEVVAEKFSIPRIFDNWETMLSSTEVDAVSVALPPALQARVVDAALDAGKHVLCEKPFGTNLAEAQAMFARAGRTDRAHTVGYLMRMEPGIAELKRQVKKGNIGDVQRIHVTWLTSGKAKPELGWSWQHSAEAGGGVIGAFLSHVIDYVEWVLESRIVHVMASADILINKRPDRSGEMRAVTAEDSCDLRCRLSNRAVASIVVSNCYPSGNGHRIEVFGSNGRIVYSLSPPFTSERASLTIHSSGDIRTVPIDRDEICADSRIPPFRRLCEQFAKFSHGAKPSDLPDFSAGLRVRQVLNAVAMSIQEGKQIEL